jgi:hypothetical protein
MVDFHIFPLASGLTDGESRGKKGGMKFGF